MKNRERPRVVIAGLGDTGVLIAGRLARSCDVVGISTRPALVSGQELGSRLTNFEQWRQSYFLPFGQFKKLDRVTMIHGRVGEANLEKQTVLIELPDGSRTTEHYDIFIIATGSTNGFWRHDRLEQLNEVEAELDAIAQQIKGAKRFAIIGGGPTGVSVADNVARSGTTDVHLFYSGDQLLPGYHPKASRWISHVLTNDGVTLHPHHRAVVPEHFNGEKLTTDPVEWSTEQPPFHADLTMWALGKIKPHSDFLPANVLDEDGFVRVDPTLRVEGYQNVFAIGDVAASDPNHSSARNWGWRVVVANVRSQLSGNGRRPKRFTAPRNRWGSIVGLQRDGLVVVQPNGKRFRVPQFVATTLLVRLFIHRYLYGGLRKK